MNHEASSVNQLNTRLYEMNGCHEHQLLPAATSNKVRQTTMNMPPARTRWLLIVLTVVSVVLLRDGVNIVDSFHINSRPSLSTAQRVVVHGEWPRFQTPPPHALFQTNTDNNDDDDCETPPPSINPYADPNYPDLEFVNYDDPEYSMDRSLLSSDDEEDETLLEQMREERRVANDEYQYNTYWHTVWNAGLSTYRGEWTVYYSNRFFPQFDDQEEDNDGIDDDDDANSLPRLIQLSDAPLTVISRATLQNATAATTTASPNSYITHLEELEQGMGDVALAMAGGADEIEQQVVSQTYWPVQLSQSDFRGHQGIMICGNAYTICDTVPLTNLQVNDDEEDSDFQGPFGEYRVEIGICANDEARFRIKLDYNVLPETSTIDSLSPPPLHLKTMVVCRESPDKWPRSSTMARSLFGSPVGAPGGLYDPPIVGGPSRSDQYCQVDLDGCATALFPVIIDQVENNQGDEYADPDDRVGWVTSLDWTAGGMRYQVDRKVHSGRHIRGLRTLELSEVQGVDADRYRPRDGGQNMRQ